jgi:glutamate synthase (NADPH/NADH) small chain
MKIIPKRTPEQERLPDECRKDFNEVVKGYDKGRALKEASRCLMCSHKPCQGGCPVGIDIPAFIKQILEGNIEEAYRIIQESNSLPGVCGRVCPQEDQCAAKCVLGKKYEPVNIGLLERYVADMASEKGISLIQSSINKSNPSIGIIGSGPSGLTLAGDMVKRGYPVVIYEALHEPGGVLRYGIPEFRLPNEIIDKEIKVLIDSGVELKTNFVIGKTQTIDELKEIHEALFIGIGAGLPKFLGIEGENLNGIYSANEYLTRSNLMKSYDYPVFHTPVKTGKAVAVIGGGNVAMDAARTAIRLGAQKVYNIYRRSRDEMPARNIEIEHALKEGVDIQFLTNPVKMTGNENGIVEKIFCSKMELGEPDSSGRRRPVEIPGSEFEIDADVVVIAIGTGPSRLLLENTQNLKLNEKGYIQIDKDTGLTSIEDVYAGGDIVTGSATVISAMGAARRIGKIIREKYNSKTK